MNCSGTAVAVLGARPLAFREETTSCTERRKAGTSSAVERVLGLLSHATVSSVASPTALDASIHSTPNFINDMLLGRRRSHGGDRRTAGLEADPAPGHLASGDRTDANVALSPEDVG